QVWESERLIRYSLVGHFTARGPDDGVEHQPPKIGIPPVPMMMASRESKTSPAIGPLGRPGHMLRLPRFRSDVRIPTMRSIRSAERAFRWNRGQNGRDPLHAIP